MIIKATANNGRHMIFITDKQPRYFFKFTLNRTSRWHRHRMEAQSTLGGKTFLPNEEITKFPNFAWYLPKISFPIFFGVGGRGGASAPLLSCLLRLWKRSYDFSKESFSRLVPLPYVYWRPLTSGDVRDKALWAGVRVTPGEPGTPRSPRAAGDLPAVSTGCRCTAAMATN